MSSGKVLLGVLAGVSAGALIGILFAPAKGSKTRKEIAKKGEDFVDELKDKFDDFLQSVSGKWQEVKEEATDFAEKAHFKKESINKDVKNV